MPHGLGCVCGTPDGACNERNIAVCTAPLLLYPILNPFASSPSPFCVERALSRCTILGPSTRSHTRVGLCEPLWAVLLPLRPLWPSPLVALMAVASQRTEVFESIESLARPAMLQHAWGHRAMSTPVPSPSSSCQASPPSLDDLLLVPACAVQVPERTLARILLPAEDKRSSRSCKAETRVSLPCLTAAERSTHHTAGWGLPARFRHHQTDTWACTQRACEQQPACVPGLRSFSRFSSPGQSHQSSPDTSCTRRAPRLPFAPHRPWPAPSTLAPGGVKAEGFGGGGGGAWRGGQAELVGCELCQARAAPVGSQSASPPPPFSPRW